MTCKELVEFLDRYLDAELPEPQRRSFEEHLDECPDCVHYLDSYRSTVRLARSACVDAEMPEDLVRAILASRGE